MPTAILSAANGQRGLDVNENLIQLYPPQVANAPQAIDSVEFSVVSSHHLERIGIGFAIPLRPFTDARAPSGRKVWSTNTLGLGQADIYVTTVSRSDYFGRLIETRALDHQSIVGVRRIDGGAMSMTRIVHSPQS